MIHPRKRAASLRGWVSAEGQPGAAGGRRSARKGHQGGIRTIRISIGPPFPCPVSARGAGWGVTKPRAKKQGCSRARAPLCAAVGCAVCPNQRLGRGITAPSCPGILSSNSGEPGVALPVSCRGAALSRHGKKARRLHKLPVLVAARRGAHSVRARRAWQPAHAPGSGRFGPGAASGRH